MSRRLRLLIFVVAYFAEGTLQRTVRRIPKTLLDHYEVEILIIDDGSRDGTFAEGVAAGQSADLPFKITVLHNPINQGYGGNQKIGYYYAMEKGFDFVALLHGDGQYAPELLPTLVEPLRQGNADAVLGSRMIRPLDALKGGMPLYKFAGNRILTALQNWLLRANLSEFHSGYRTYSVATLRTLPFERNSSDFHFDTEIIIQLLIAKKRIKEVPIPTYYGDEICYVNGLRYARNVVKASLQARLQEINLFYDRRFDCAAPAEGEKYPSKLDFVSTHSRVLELIPAAASVLDLGCGLGSVGAALKKKKDCRVVGCDVEQGPLTRSFDRFVRADLNQGLPEFSDNKFDYIIALDVIEHLSNPEKFLDDLRALAARTSAKVILTTANVSFILMRLMLLIGRFEYGKRGILDITHTRLFTLPTLKRAMLSAGFYDLRTEGIVVPVPFVFGSSPLSKLLMTVNRALVRVLPRLFGFQLLVVATPRPTLATLLDNAQQSAADKMPAALVRFRKREPKAA